MVERYKRVEIYCAYNTVNGKCYVGQTRVGAWHRVFRCHAKLKKTSFQRALRKYGLGVFRLSVIDIAYDNKSANTREQFWIEQLQCRYPAGYNMTSGGEGVPNPTTKHRAAIIAANKRRMGTHHREESKRAIGLAHKGRKMTPEWRAKWIASMQANYWSNDPVTAKKRSVSAQKSCLKRTRNSAGRFT